VEDPKLLQDQIAYYRARAPQYDEWFFRQGAYDHGEAHRQQWFEQIGQVESALRDEKPEGRILELAAGTGLWTTHLAALADRLTAVDASPEALELNRQRVRSTKVEYRVEDLFNWQPTKQYDFAFLGFWLSHVPGGRVEDFWQRVALALKPDGKAFFVDSLFTQEIPRKHAPPNSEGIQLRKLGDEREFRVVKIYHKPEDLRQQLELLGWSGYVHSTGQFFYYGCVSR